MNVKWTSHRTSFFYLPCSILFTPLVYLYHFLNAFVCTGSLSGDGGWDLLVLELSVCCRGAGVPECQLAQPSQGITLLSSFFPIPLLGRSHLELVHLLWDFIVFLAGGKPVRTDHITKLLPYDWFVPNLIVCCEWGFLSMYVGFQSLKHQKNTELSQLVSGELSAERGNSIWTGLNMK